MSETKKAGVVTELYLAADAILEVAREIDGANTRVAHALADFLWDEEDEEMPTVLQALDLVASWPPELQQAVELIDKLPAEAKAILPHVLLGLMNEGPAAVMAAAVGKPVSAEARLALWASGLSLEDIDALRNALLAVEDEDADHAGELAMELLPMRESMASRPADGELGKPVSTAAKVAAWAGGLSEEELHLVKNALLRPGADDESQAAQELGHQLRCILEEAQPLDFNAARILASRMPRSTGKPEPRVWKAGTVPPEMRNGMVFLDTNGDRAFVLSDPTGLGHVMVRRQFEERPHVRDAWSILQNWKLADDFPVPEDAC